MNVSTLDLGASKKQAQLTITVRVRGLRVFRVRAWLTAMVLHIAGWVSPVPIVVEMPDDQAEEPKREGEWIVVPQGMTLAEAEARLAMTEGAESGCVASATHPKPGGGSKVGA